MRQEDTFPHLRESQTQLPPESSMKQIQLPSWIPEKLWLCYSHSMKISLLSAEALVLVIDLYNVQRFCAYNQPQVMHHLQQKDLSWNSWQPPICLEQKQERLFLPGVILCLQSKSLHGWKLPGQDPTVLHLHPRNLSHRQQGAKEKLGLWVQSPEFQN